jgi:iron complex transport system ATP-binding protein
VTTREPRGDRERGAESADTDAVGESTPAGEAATVVVEDVRVTLGDTDALRGVSATVEPGTVLGLVGPNGAGKTTLLRATNGTLSPDAGRVLVGGDRVDRLDSAAASRRVATVPQDDGVRFAFSVREVVAMGRYPHRSRFGHDPDPGAVDRAIERTDLAGLADRRIDAVSGGQRRRALLARALAAEAPVLALDEPTASLDVDHAVRTLELVRRAVADGRTAVAAVHDLDLAARFCDELLVVADGRALARGPPEEVLTADTVREAFGVEAVVVDHPVTGDPLVTPGVEPE